MSEVKPGTSAAAAYTALPWTYTTLDIAQVKKRGYENYYIGGCMYATATALLDTLIETVGPPWDTIPRNMFGYGGGGIASRGTICGALNAAGLIIRACAGTHTTAVINNLYHWYCGFPFPSDSHDSYAKYTMQKTCISNSPLCHSSSNKWAHYTKNSINSPERRDRCAKLAGDVAGKTAELLNRLKTGASFQREPR